MGPRDGPRPFRGPNYRRGYTGRDFHVTGGHEAEAEAAEEAKKPSRFGMWVLRRLGYRGSPGEGHESGPGHDDHGPTPTADRDFG
jgi:hypothetical protein